MKEKKTDIGVLVGRFQVAELSSAHEDLIRSVCKQHPRTILFLGLGCVKSTINNPLDFTSRKNMIAEIFPEIDILYIKDQQINEDWSNNLDEQIRNLAGPGQTVTLYGSRDSFIQHYTGKYKTQELLQESFVSGTEIRKQLSTNSRKSADWRAGACWYSQNQYLKPTITVDIAIFNEDETKILLGRKKEETLFRFIGGFVDNGETFEHAAKRETKEEIGSNAETSDYTYIGSSIIDDWRYRGEKETITTALFKCKLAWGKPEPSDDIYELKWFNVKELGNTQIVKNHRQLWKMVRETLPETPGYIVIEKHGPSSKCDCGCSTIDLYKDAIALQDIQIPEEE